MKVEIGNNRAYIIEKAESSFSKYVISLLKSALSKR
jgi:hypothetical protein